jgi:hypothetical protein
MTSQAHDPEESGHRDDSDRTTDEWIDESMAEGDIANGEGDPERSDVADGGR